MARRKVRIVVFQEGKSLCAHFVDFDLATQAPTLSELYRSISKTLIGHVVVRQRHGLKPFADLPPAPRKYVEMFERSKIELPPQIVPIATEAHGVVLPSPAVRVAVASPPAA